MEKIRTNRSCAVQLRLSDGEYDTFQEAVTLGGWPNVSAMLRALVTAKLQDLRADSAPSDAAGE